MSHRRIVALGDSTAQGIGDPGCDGGPRGWTDRVAELATTLDPATRYANLAVRGKLIAQIRAEQLQPALALHPDLVLFAGGFNDLLRPRYRPQEARRELRSMLNALRETGTTVVTVTFPDLSEFAWAARVIRPRLARFNHAIRQIGSDTGTIVVDLAGDMRFANPALWDSDRMHASPTGHAMIAAAVARSLGLDVRGSDASVTNSHPGPSSMVVSELVWATRHMLPWIYRRVRGRSSGDGLQPKRPSLSMITPHGETT